MSLENFIACQMCRKPFQRFGSGKICNACLEQIEIDFRAIKEYLYENPGRISVSELSEKTEVHEKVILHLMREKRLEIVDTTGGGLLCEVCRAPISSGVMCDKCKESLSKSLEKAVHKPQTPEPEETKTPISTKSYGKMHTYRKDE